MVADVVGLEKRLRQTNEERERTSSPFSEQAQKGRCKEAIRRHPREKGCRAMNSTPPQSDSAKQGTPLKSEIGQL